MKDETARQQDTTPLVEADQRAIEAVIRQEIDAFFHRDFAAWSACYLQTDKLRSTMMSHELGLDVRVGWQAHVDGTRLHFDGTHMDAATWEKEIEQIVVAGDMAWLTCRARTNTNLCQMGESYETCILERHAGAWKIACVNVMAARAFSLTDQRIAMDADGHVVGLGARAARHIQDHPGFSLRNGRLHAADARIDRDLKAAIKRAGALHGYFEQAAYADMEGQRFACPLVLERDDGDGHEVIMITVQDRQTYIDFGATAAAVARVDASAMMFGLSAAQHRVVQGIVAGQSLPSLAQDMGISPTTAKTHLQRVYEKTGTHGMTALVRVMLSIG